MNSTEMIASDEPSNVMYSFLFMLPTRPFAFHSITIKQPASVLSAHLKPRLAS